MFSGVLVILKGEKFPLRQVIASREFLRHQNIEAYNAMDEVKEKLNEYIANYSRGKK